MMMPDIWSRGVPSIASNAVSLQLAFVRMSQYVGRG
jgi:hypothetical protein